MRRTHQSDFHPLRVRTAQALLPHRSSRPLRSLKPSPCSLIEPPMRLASFFHHSSFRCSVFCTRVLFPLQGRGVLFRSSNTHDAVQGRGLKGKRMAVAFRLAWGCQKVVIAKAKVEEAAISIQWAWRRYLRRSQGTCDDTPAHSRVERRRKAAVRSEADIWTSAVAIEEGK